MPEEMDPEKLLLTQGSQLTSAQLRWTLRSSRPELRIFLQRHAGGSAASLSAGSSVCVAVAL